MKDKRLVLLTIAIPTFNRCDILEKALFEYINDSDFDDNIEIVILDNCSTDNTEKICSKFAILYTNIRYYKNETNIGAKNYVAALSKGKGLYLKLMNDNCLIKPGFLRYLKNNILENLDSKRPIFFYNNSEFESNCILNVNTLDDFVKFASYWITYNNNFGVWKDHFDLMQDKDRYSEVHWAQVDISLRLVSQYKNAILLFSDGYTALEVKSKNYDLFRLFSVEYLKLYTEYLNKKDLTLQTLNLEKYRLFHYFLRHWYFRLVINKDKEIKFGKENVVRVLLKNYKFKYYFYFDILRLYKNHYTLDILKYKLKASFNKL